MPKVDFLAREPLNVCKPTWRMKFLPYTKAKSTFVNGHRITKSNFPSAPFGFYDAPYRKFFLWLIATDLSAIDCEL